MNGQWEWVLIQGQFTPEEGRMFALDLPDPVALPAGWPPFPVQASGRVLEVVRIPAGTASSFDPRLRVRPVGWLERTARQAYRVYTMGMRLSPAQRRQAGISLLSAWRDLPEAYRAVTRFRGLPYPEWISVADTLSGADKAAIRARIAAWTAPPRFVLVLDGGDEAARQVTLDTLSQQLYPHHQICNAPPGRSDAWLMFLRPGDRLAEHALYWFAHQIRLTPDAAMIYSDDDELDESGARCRPRFKPDWSIQHLRATDYIGRAVVLNPAMAAGLAGEVHAGEPWPLLLRIAERSEGRVVHLPAVLLHRNARWEQAPVVLRVRYGLPEPSPRVSIVIPTRDALPVLRQCVESLLARTVYPRYEILVVDNGSRCPEALAYLAGIDGRSIAGREGDQVTPAGDVADNCVRVLRYDKPFNFAAINNFAVAQARGDVLCLLNNDTEVISPDWLDEMIGHLHQDQVGVVGAKLYYPDGRVQHAGDIVGPGGCARHLHAFLGRDEPGYCHRAIVAQELSAVTAACLVTWRKLYMRLGGLDARNLPVAFNDVDYCLRVREEGFKVVWTPHAELYHHESISRGKDISYWRRRRANRELAYMQRRWRDVLRRDPFYNPNFSYARPDFMLSPAPDVRLPWLEDELG